MIERRSFWQKAGLLALGFLASVPLGVVGGVVCGAAILSLNVLLGRSQTTGMHFGDWNPAVAWVGSLYGGMLGGLVTPAAYVLMIRKIGFQKSFWPSAAGTIAGGFVGAVAGPLQAVIGGIIGFFAGLCWALFKKPRTGKSDPISARLQS